MKLVDFQLRSRVFGGVSGSGFMVEDEANMMPQVQRRRTPEEFQAYLKGIFENRDPILEYHWYFSSIKKRKKQYCGINY